MNAITTVLVLGSLFLLVRLALKYRGKLIPSLALLVFALAGVGLVPHLTSTVAAKVALLTMAAVITAATVGWSEPLTGTVPT